MRLNQLPTHAARRLKASAFTLMEVVISIVIAAVVFAGIITAYIQTTQRAEWTGYSLAAQALAIQQLEQARSAVWDPSLGKNEVTNLNLVGFTYNNSTKVGRGYSWSTLDVPIAGGNFTYATNFVTITMLTNVTGAPGVFLQFVRVDTVWPFTAGGQKKFFTNSIGTYLAPDNRDATTL